MSASWISFPYTINSYSFRKLLNFAANTSACDTGTSSSSAPARNNPEGGATFTVTLRRSESATVVAEALH